MIAIACAKGGSGKTTTTLGLAAAFARADEQALAIDADQQLPDLHMTAGVDRAPTIADVDADGDWRSVAAPLPGSQGAYVLPGAREDDVVDLQSTLERLQSDDSRLLVDCPSGSGPDVIEPLAAADGVVVATPPSNRGISAARTTVDVATQLDVPVLGVVVTKCDSRVQDVDVDLPAPVLATVPESRDPLGDERAAAAYDATVASLQDSREDTEEPQELPETTPDPAVDSSSPEAVLEELQPGSVVALHAPAASQSESFCHAATNLRGTLYLTTDRSETLVSAALEDAAVETGSPTIRSLDAESPLDHAGSLVDQLPAHSNLVVDTANGLERCDRDAYAAFLNDLAETVKDTESLAVLHCLEPATDPETRALTDHVADVVVSLGPTGRSVAPHDALTIEKRRSVPPAFDEAPCDD